MTTASWMPISLRHKNELHDASGVECPSAPLAVPVNRPERIARMNDKKRDYIIMTVATISILALLVLFYVVLSHFMI